MDVDKIGKISHNTGKKTGPNIDGLIATLSPLIRLMNPELALKFGVPMQKWLGGGGLRYGAWGLPDAPQSSRLRNALTATKDNF